MDGGSVGAGVATVGLAVGGVTVGAGLIVGIRVGSLVGIETTVAVGASVEGSNNRR